MSRHSILWGIISFLVCAVLGIYALYAWSAYPFDAYHIGAVIAVSLIGGAWLAFHDNRGSV